MNELTPLARWTVRDDEIDDLGHMNMQFYALRAGKAAVELVARLGLDAEALAAQGLVLTAVDQHTMYRREQMVGAALSVHGGLHYADADTIGAYIEISNDATAQVAAAFHVALQARAAASRAPSRFAPALVEAARARLVSPPARNAPRSLPRQMMRDDVTIAVLAKAGVASHLQRPVTPAECDEYGFLKPPPPRRFPIDPANSISQGVMDHIWDGSPDGFAWPTLEARTLTLMTPRAGDVLAHYSAIIGLTHKIIEWATWILEVRSGALVSITQQVNIFFNLKTRRTHDLPPAEHARLQALTTSSLSVARVALH